MNEKILELLAETVLEITHTKLAKSEIIEAFKDAIDEAELFDYNGNQT